MLTYWTVYLVPALLAIARIRVRFLGWFLLGACLTAFLGLRFRVGTDWVNYLDHYYYPQLGTTLWGALVRPDPGFQLLNWLAVQFGCGIWFVNLVCSAIFSAGLIRFVRRLPEPLTALTAALPYVAIVVAMNYERQAAAIGIMLWAFCTLYERRIWKYILTVCFAAIFHRTAIIFVPLFALVSERNRMELALLAAASSVLAYFVFLASRFDALWQQYVLSQYSQASQGAPVRVAMNALPALVFLIFRNRFDLGDVEKRVWTWISLASLICMVFVFKAPTAVDRIALYFSPIQFVVAAYITRMFEPSSRFIVRLMMVAIYAAVLYVWLVDATNAGNWFPYRLWPFFSQGIGPIQ